MTTSDLPKIAKSAWHITREIGILVSLLIAVAVTMGFRLDQSTPNARFHTVEQKDSTFEMEQRIQDARLTALETQAALNSSKLELLVRLQCLSMSRHDANLADVCEKYAVKDDILHRP